MYVYFPIEVRWNTFHDTACSYVKNWPILLKFSKEHRGDIDSEISTLIQNIGFKRNCEDLIQIIEPIATATKQIQPNECNIGDSVLIWKTLEKSILPVLNKSQSNMFYKRYQMALKPCHFAAFLLSPKKANSMDPEYPKLSTDENKMALQFFEEEFPLGFVPIYLKFQAKLEPFSGTMMRKEVLESLSDIEWWKSFAKNNIGLISDQNFGKMIQLLTASASSSAVERIFSSLGQVHTKLRNRLGVEKAGKLAFLYKQLNK